jgi:uncharacterized protein
VTGYLLDANVLIALAWPHHVHHEAAHRWFAKTGRDAFATCAVTQLAFVRISSNPAIIADAVAPAEACKLLGAVTRLSGHRYWPEAVPPEEIEEMRSIALVGHRQVTDAYLLGLARHHQGRLATFDRGMRDLANGVKGARSLVELLDPRSGS